MFGMEHYYADKKKKTAQNILFFKSSMYNCARSMVFPPAV